MQLWESKLHSGGIYCRDGPNLVYELGEHGCCIARLQKTRDWVVFGDSPQKAVKARRTSNDLSILTADKHTHLQHIAQCWLHRGWRDYLLTQHMSCNYGISTARLSAAVSKGPPQNLAQTQGNNTEDAQGMECSTWHWNTPMMLLNALQQLIEAAAGGKAQQLLEVTLITHVVYERVQQISCIRIGQWYKRCMRAATQQQH